MVEVRSLIATVAERISETLHIPRVAVLLGGGGPYRPAYALGYGSSPDIAFPIGAGTVKVLQRQKEPARVYLDDPHSWLYREPEVTEEDRAKLTQLDAELLLPLSARDEAAGIHQPGPEAFRRALLAHRPAPAEVGSGANRTGAGECPPHLRDRR